jgi:hypothetical protein
VANSGDPKHLGRDCRIICITARLTRTLVALDGGDESFGYSVALRTFDRRCYRLETDLTGKVWSCALDLIDPFNWASTGF